MRLQKLHEAETHSATTTEPSSKKRKASDDEDDGTIHKRSKPANGIPEGFFDPRQEEAPMIARGIEMQIPSRPATPSKPVETPVSTKPEPDVDEDEWAAFEADIATAEAQAQVENDAIISAPAISAQELAKKTAEEDYTAKKERQEAELEGDKEDAARKMEEELQEMESLEARVKKMREKREALRKKEGLVPINSDVVPPARVEIPEEDEDEDEDYDDDWDNFRMKG